MENKNNKPQIDPDFNNIWDTAGQYKYSFEANNNDAWEKFSNDRAKVGELPTNNDLGLVQTPFTVHKNLKQILRVAAAITMIAIGTWAFWFNNNQSAILESGSITSTQGEIKEISMKDGSKIILNSNSTVTYSVTAKNRQITLKGMAHFEVAKNPNAPFVIQTANNQVTVLGTGFDVCSYQNKPLQVTVNHGKVKVEKCRFNANKNGIHQIAQGIESVVLTKGMRVTQNSSSNGIGRYLNIDSAVNLTAVQWDQGDLIFNNASLADVISAVEMRYGVQIEVLGNAPRGLRNNPNPRFTATFNKNNNLNEVCKVIGNAMDLTLTHNP